MTDLWIVNYWLAMPQTLIEGWGIVSYPHEGLRLGKAEMMDHPMHNAMFISS